MDLGCCINLCVYACSQDPVFCKFRAYESSSSLAAGHRHGWTPGPAIPPPAPSIKPPAPFRPCIHPFPFRSSLLFSSLHQPQRPRTSTAHLLSAPRAAVGALAHGLPTAATKAASSLLVVCLAGRRAEAVALALKAATGGTLQATNGGGRGLPFRASFVVRAAKGSDDDGHIVPEGNDDKDAGGVIFVVPAGSDDMDADAVVLTGGEEEKDRVVVTGGEEDKDRVVITGGQEDKDHVVVTGGPEDKDRVVVTGGEEEKAGELYRFGNREVFIPEMTLYELLMICDKETSRLLNRARPRLDKLHGLNILKESHQLIKDEMRKLEMQDAPVPGGGRRVAHLMVGLHLRVVAWAGKVEGLQPHHYLPGFLRTEERYRLPSKSKLAGTLMELLLYSMMMASNAITPFLPEQVFDFTNYP
ncbi:uncharacterized protein LOC125507533 [Triticum urartu]|uniref:uncharacterized protein LOC125507533 n=1 Tax=Triticum urartu TaxID=4572 RepID=UPI0020430EAC|nr:uncharacterized protein LOC125507533 [Triticum urartu]